MNDSFICGCCEQFFPILHQHTHHKVPQAIGGTDHKENLIDLCPGCHNTIHNAAYKLLSRKISHGKIIDSIALIYKDNRKAQRICLELAIKVRDSLLKSQEEGVDPNHLVNVCTILRKKHKDLLYIHCKESRVSQERYLRSLILRDLSPRFPGKITTDDLLPIKRA